MPADSGRISALYVRFSLLQRGEPIDPGAGRPSAADSGPDPARYAAKGRRDPVDAARPLPPALPLAHSKGVAHGAQSLDAETRSRCSINAVLDPYPRRTSLRSARQTPV